MFQDVTRTILCSGRWIYHNIEQGRCGQGLETILVVTDVILHGVNMLYGYFILFSLSSGVFTRTSSHICGRWYLPMFQYGDGDSFFY